MTWGLGKYKIRFLVFHSAFPKTTFTLGITHEKQGWTGEAAKTRGRGQLAQQLLHPHHGAPAEQTRHRGGPYGIALEDCSGKEA